MPAIDADSIEAPTALEPSAQESLAGDPVPAAAATTLGAAIGALAGATGQVGSEQLAHQNQAAFDGSGIVSYFPNGEGPSAWHFIYDPGRKTALHDHEGIPPASFLAGRTPVYVAFRTGHAAQREDAADPYLAPYTRKALRELRKTPGLENLQVLWVDEASKRPPHREGFDFLEIPTLPGNVRDPEQIRGLAIQIAEHVKNKGGVIVGAGSQFSNRLLFPSVLQEHVRDSGMNPYIPVNPLKTVFDTKIKSRFRQKIAEHAPQRAVPYSAQEFPPEFDAVLAQARLDGITHEQDALATEKRERWWDGVGAPMMQPAVERMLAEFRRMRAENPGREFVMKPDEAAGKMGFQGDIATEADAATRYLKIFNELMRFYLSPGRSRSSLPDRFKLQIELKLRTKAGEYDVEFVLRRVPGGRLEVKALPIGNPTPVPVTMTEGGMTFPAMLSRELSIELILSALESALAAAHPSLPFFNRHDEVMLDDGKVFLPIESNWPRSGGGLRTFSVVSRFLGAYYEDGMRSAMGLPLTPLRGQQTRTAVVRKALAAVTGFVREVIIDPELFKLEWLHVSAPVVNSAVSARESWPRVISAEHPENSQGSNDIGVIAWSDPGQPQEQALSRARYALSRIWLRIRTNRDDPTTESIYPAGHYHVNGYGDEKRFPLVPVLDASIESVLMVCTGNMFRSPLAAHFFERGLREMGVVDVSVFSRGMKVNRSAQMSAVENEALKAYGLDPERRLSTQVTAGDAAKASLILVMTLEHKRELLARFPGIGGKVHLLNEFAGLGELNLVDPAGSADSAVYLATAESIRGATERVLRKLSTP